MAEIAAQVDYSVDVVATAKQMLSLLECVDARVAFSNPGDLCRAMDRYRRVRAPCFTSLGAFSRLNSL
jgi:hypothetical protein